MRLIALIFCWVNKVKFSKKKSPLTFQYLSKGQELKKKEEKKKPICGI